MVTIVVNVSFYFSLFLLCSHYTKCNIIFPHFSAIFDLLSTLNCSFLQEPAPAIVMGMANASLMGFVNVKTDTQALTAPLVMK